MKTYYREYMSFSSGFRGFIGRNFYIRSIAISWKRICDEGPYFNTAPQRYFLCGGPRGCVMIFLKWFVKYRFSSMVKERLACVTIIKHVCIRFHCLKTRYENCEIKSRPDVNVETLEYSLNGICLFHLFLPNNRSLFFACWSWCTSPPSLLIPNLGTEISLI